MKQKQLKIISNNPLTASVYQMKLEGLEDAFIKPGQFVNLKTGPQFLRRPISVCDVEGDVLTLVYRAAGAGTKWLSRRLPGETVDALLELGNGYDTFVSGEAPVLIGGGVGVPPLYFLARNLVHEGFTPTVILGFNTVGECFYETEFKMLDIPVHVTTADGSYGIKGFVTDAMPETYSYFYACGPLPMLKALYKTTTTSGQFSLEERMGCGFGACMGCSIETASGPKRVCKDGPVFAKEELLWND